MNDFSTISIKFLGKITSIIGVVFLLLISYFCFQIYVPVNPDSNEIIIYTVQKGWGDEEIADNLKDLGIVRSSYFFKLYNILSLKHRSLQAGEYNLSTRMSIHQIANKMFQGDTIKDTVVIVEGWDINDIAKYLETKNICTQSYFVSLTKAKGLEGYLFPDTYEIAKGATCEDILSAMRANFDRKLTSELRAEIVKQKKTVSDIVIMASLIEKEVITLQDKKIVSGILWKRLSIGMPLQVDATIVYITGDPNISKADKAINSPYNTYMYRGLPKGPISNPGLDSIIAAIYPTQTNYLYYLTDGKTIFSETLDEHNAAKAKYLSD